MSPDTPTPLERSREDALTNLRRLIWWALTPVAALLIVSRLVIDRAGLETRWILVVSTPILIAGLLAALMRPSPSRSLTLRGHIAIGMMAFVGAWGLVLNGPRAANTVALAIVVSLAVLFLDRPAAFWGVVSVLIAAGLGGIVLRSTSLLAPPPPYGSGFELATAALMIAGLGYCAHILWVTLRNYNRGQRELLQRSRQLMETQAEAQRLQRQEMVARLATALAGEVATQLDADLLSHPAREATGRLSGTPVENASVVETRARATQTLRLLESLGHRSSERSAPTNVRSILRKVDDAIRPMLGSEETVDVLDASTGAPQIAADTLEQIVLHLALQARGASGSCQALVIRAFDGLGDVTRSDGRRTWTIIEIGCVRALHDEATEVGREVSANTDVGSVLVDMVVATAGGRLTVDRTAGRPATFVLQLPSS